MVTFSHLAIAFIAEITLPSTRTHLVADRTRDNAGDGIGSTLWKGPATFSTAKRSARRASAAQVTNV